MYYRIDRRPDASPEKEESAEKANVALLQLVTAIAKDDPWFAIVRFALLAVISLADGWRDRSRRSWAPRVGQHVDIHRISGGSGRDAGNRRVDEPPADDRTRHRHSPVVRCDRRWLGEQRRRGLDATHRGRDSQPISSERSQLRTPR